MVVRESESSGLRAFLSAWPEQASSVVLDVEAHRFATRTRDPSATARTTLLVRSLTLLPVSADVLHLARTLHPPTLRTIDAIHLATALRLGSDLGVLVAYDRQLLDAARGAGLTIASPA